MGTISPVSNPFLPGSKKKGEATSKSSFKSTETLAENSLGVGGHRYTRIFSVSKLLWVSTEVRFFSEEKFTKFDLAPTLVIKNHSKVGYTWSMMFLRI